MTVAARDLVGLPDHFSNAKTIHVCDSLVHARDIASHFGAVACTWPGKRAHWRQANWDRIYGRTVTLIACASSASRKRMEELADHLAEHECQVFVALPSGTGGEGPADWCAAGVEEAKAKIHKLRREWKPVAAPEPAQPRVRTAGDSEGDLARHWCAEHPEYRYHRVHGWMAFDAGQWRRDQEPDANRAMVAFVDRLTMSDEKARRRLFKAISLRGALTVARSIAHLDGGFDDAEHLIGLPDGRVMDLRTATMRDGSEADRVSRHIGAVPDPDLPTPAWDSLLAHLAPSAEARGYLQRHVGFTLTGRSAPHRVLLVTGPGGSGKSTFMSTITKLSSGYHAALPADALTSRNDKHPDWMASLSGVRLATIAELQAGQLRPGPLKQLSGGDEAIRVRFMYGSNFDMKPICKLVLAGEHKPGLPRSAGEGIRRRLVLLPCTEFPKDRADESIVDRIAQELPGIAAWAVEGARVFFAEALGTAPAEWQREAMDYLASEDLFRQWFTARCEIEDGYELRSELRKDFTEHTGAKTRWTPMQEWFIAKKIGRTGAVNGKDVWRGIRLKTKNQ